MTLAPGQHAQLLASVHAHGWSVMDLSIRVGLVHWLVALGLISLLRLQAAGWLDDRRERSERRQRGRRL